MCLEEFEKTFNQVFDANDGSLGDANAFLVSSLEGYNVSFKTQMQLELVLEEIFVNISHYGYPEGNGKVSIDIGINEKQILLVFKDNGLQFDPLQKKDPNVELSAEERKIGGLGIYLVKEIMNEVEYRFENNTNILSCLKVFSQDEA